METTTCIHQEKIEALDHGLQHGTCKICHQVRGYDSRDDHQPPKVIKLGRINGRIVLPSPNDIPSLAPQEAAELKAAKKAIAAEKPGATEKEKVADIPTEKPISKGRQWYQERKKEMIEDPIIMENAAFMEKWKVNRQIISHLKSDKLYLERVAPAETLGVRVSKSKHSGKRSKSHSSKKQVVPHPVWEERGEVDQLPPLPAWAPEKWVSGEIAVQWLKTYEILYRLQLIERLAVTESQRGITESRLQEAHRIPARRRSWLARLFKR